MARSPPGRQKRAAAARKLTPSTSSRSRPGPVAKSHGYYTSPVSTQSRHSTVNSIFPAKVQRPGPCVEETPTGDTLEEVAEDDLCQVVMAIDIKERGTVGCSYYVAARKLLYILEDITLGGMDVVETLKLDIEPTVVLVSTRADRGPHIPGLQDADGTGSTYDAQFQLPYQLEVRPSQEFGYESAKTKLTGLKLEEEVKTIPKFLVPGNAFSDESAMEEEDVGFTDQQGKFLHLASVIDMENQISIGCAGALITYLQRKRSTQYLQGDSAGDQQFNITAIEMLSLEGSMFINRDTLASLQIIQSEPHPNAYNQGPGKTSSGAKESLSLYGLFHRFARTPQGKGVLKQMFLRPSVRSNVIQERHDFISTFLKSDNYDAMEKLIKSLRGIKNLRPVMIHLQKGISTGNAKFRGFKNVVWTTLLEFAFHSIDIHEALKEVIGAERLDLCVKALHKLDLAQLHQVGRAIHETVDLESSIQEHRNVVKSRVDQDLDKLKETYNGMDSLLSQVAVAIAASLPDNLSNELNVIYFPQLGFNIAIPLNEQGRPVYNGGNEEWTQVFSTENRAYFKDFRMREMDERLGDMYGSICEKEIEIIYTLAQKILGYEKMLTEASDVCGEIDSLLALAQGASLYKLVRPHVTEENIIKIRGGRHLIHEATVPSYVPNDTFLVGGKGGNFHQFSRCNSPDFSETSSGTSCPDGPSMLLLTGPNYSGKSVYLKQVALIVYMAHIGSFVPAENATIGLTDKILTRITTRETVSKTQSTFAIDLQQASFAITYSTHRSLVVIDEFGKGTELTDGVGLACGLFEHFLNLSSDRPKIVAATHFHELFESGFLPERPELQLGYMEVQMDPTAPELEDQITYLYKLVTLDIDLFLFRLGRSVESFGTLCAAINGIDPAIVSRANEIGELSRRGEDLVAVCARMTPVEMKELEDAELIARRFLEADLTRPDSNISQRSESESAASILSAIVGITTSNLDVTGNGEDVILTESICSISAS